MLEVCREAWSCILKLGMGVGQIMLLNRRKARALAAMQTADFVVGFCLRMWPHISASYVAVSGEARKLHDRFRSAAGKTSGRIGRSSLQTFKAKLLETRRVGWRDGPASSLKHSPTSPEERSQAY